MSPHAPRYACLWVPHFAAAALVRSDPDLRGRPVAALVGTPATRTVAEASAEARAAGIGPGMSAGEAVTRASGLVCRERDPEAERSASAALLDVALATSPRVEAAASDRVHLDLAGLALLGDERQIGERLALGAESLDLPARVAIASTRPAAALATRAAAGLTLVPPGGEAACLAPLPVALLEPSPELATALERWGIRSLGELAALPPAGLLVRLGAEAARLRARARGEDAAPFVPYVAAEPCVEALALDWEVGELEGLLFVLRHLLERLAARLALREQGASTLELTAGLADGTAHRRRLPLAAPLREPRTLLGLLRADLEGLSLPAPIVSLAVLAETAPLRPAQPDLFEPKRPSPHELARTLGELCALVGAERVGAPALGDTHRPTAVGVAPFTGAVARQAAVAALTLGDAARLACRRLSPPLPAVVLVRDGEPRHVEAPGVTGPVVACAGPWRTAGEWWTDTAWSREEWDVALPAGGVYRLVLDRPSGSWSIDAVYD
ncbi:MAG: DNA polymerase Y family protein [Candidatus Rokubacteria bacterium]|nr:DNA polymerase Y family protein [Candidatus Rokubacteria bacterium]